MSENEFVLKVCSNISKLRKAKGLSQAELAMECNEELYTIEQLENGKTDPPILLINHIANALDVPVRDLID